MVERNWWNQQQFIWAFQVGTLSIQLILTPNHIYLVREKGKIDGASNGTYYTVNDFPPSCINWLIWRSDTAATLRKYESLKEKRKLCHERTTTTTTTTTTMTNMTHPHSRHIVNTR